MKQRHIVGRIIYALFAIFVVVYIIGMVWDAFYNPIKTVSAVHIEADDSIEVTGFVVREEKALDAYASGIVKMQIAEGERASKGDVVAYVYNNKDALDKINEKNSINERIARLETILNQGSEVVDLKSVDNAIVKMSEELNQYYESGDFLRMEQTISQLKDKTMSREYVYRDKTDLQNVINELKNQRKAIGNAYASKTIYASKPGYYSGNSDGMESALSCSSIQTLTPTRFAELENSVAMNSQNDGTLGKIVSEYYWNYAFVVSSEQAERISVGKKVKIDFESPLYPDVTAEVSWKSAEEDGRVCIALKVDEHIGEFTLARTLRANVVIRTYEGLKIPHEALRMSEEGVEGVYTLVDSQVKFKPVKTIFEKDSYYIVEYNRADTKSLLLYDEIVVSAKDLKHKKMVK